MQTHSCKCGLARWWACPPESCPRPPWGPLCCLHSPAVATASRSWPSSCGFFPSRAVAGPKRLCGLQALKPAASLVTLTEPWCHLRVFSPPRSVLLFIGSFPFSFQTGIVQKVKSFCIASVVLAPHLPVPRFYFSKSNPFSFLAVCFPCFCISEFCVYRAVS